MRSVVPLLALVACSSAELATADVTEPVPPPSDTATSPSLTATDTATAPQPRYWSLGGTLAVAAGEVELSRTTIFVRSWSDEPAALCNYAVSVMEAVPAVFEAPEPVLLGWWSFQLDAADGEDGCAPWPARSLELGIGPVDDRLDPGLAANDWQADSLHGLYLREGPTEPLYLFGITGTAEQLDGTQPAFDAAPLDGLFELETLILLDLP